MPCNCKKIDQIAAPDDPCIICIQKHYLTADGAMHEYGHLNNANRNCAIKELQLALLHSAENYPEIASRIHALRRQVQYRQDIPAEDWKTVTAMIDQVIEKELFSVPALPAKKLTVSPSSPSRPSRPSKIYVFSNVKYPEKNKIHPAENDILVFLNKAETINFYPDHKKKIVYHRAPQPEYGELRKDAMNKYVFGHPESIPRKFIDYLKEKYDWNYPIEEGRVKCMTTGYMVVKWLEQLYKDSEIILVNFGYEVQKSTYRCPWHNWKFEAEQLKTYNHIYLEESKK